MSSEKASFSNNSIDLFKFIFAFVVIAIHTAPLIMCQNPIILNSYFFLTELAVPFFFMASGYLLALKMDYPYQSNVDVYRIKKTLMRVLKLYLIWTLIYSPMALYNYMTSADSVKRCVYMFFKGFFFLGEQYNSWHLWYLLSMLYALLVIFVLLKKKLMSMKGILIISVVLCFASLFMDSFMGIDFDLLSSGQVKVRNFIDNTIVYGRFFRGMIYIPVGMFIAHKRLPSIFNWVMFVVGCFFQLFVANTIVIRGLLIVLAAIGLFGIIERIKLKDSKVYKYLRQSSTVIYFVHMYMWTLYYSVVYGQRSLGLDTFLATSVLSLLCAVIFIVFRKCLSTIANFRKK